MNELKKDNEVKFFVELKEAPQEYYKKIFKIRKKYPCYGEFVRFGEGIFILENEDGALGFFTKDSFKIIDPIRGIDWKANYDRLLNDSAKQDKYISVLEKERAEMKCHQEALQRDFSVERTSLNISRQTIVEMEEKNAFMNAKVSDMDKALVCRNEKITEMQESINEKQSLLTCRDAEITGLSNVLDINKDLANKRHEEIDALKKTVNDDLIRRSNPSWTERREISDLKKEIKKLSRDLEAQKLANGIVTNRKDYKIEKLERRNRSYVFDTRLLKGTVDTLGTHLKDKTEEISRLNEILSTKEDDFTSRHIKSLEKQIDTLFNASKIKSDDMNCEIKRLQNFIKENDRNYFISSSLIKENEKLKKSLDESASHAMEILSKRDEKIRKLKLSLSLANACNEAASVGKNDKINYLNSEIEKRDKTLKEKNQAIKELQGRLRWERF